MSFLKKKKDGVYAVIVIFEGPGSEKKAMKLGEAVERVSGLIVTVSELDLEKMKDALVR